jgi:mono/diheme cytochrome c family protein
MIKHCHKTLSLFALAASVAFLGSSAMGQDSAESTYKAKCAVCHAADGSGDTAMGKKLEVQSFNAPAIAKLSDAVFLEVTIKGKGKMPGYEKKLTDDQIKDLVKYIRGLGKK